MATRNDDAKEVGRIRGRANITTGRPRRLTMGVNGARTKVAFGATGGTMGGMGGNFYSPELSTDFLELPQSMDEQRNVYRFFYRTHPFVHQAINIHTELPLSKIRLGMPHARNRGLAEKSLRFCEKWATRINLLRRLIEVIHEFHLLGEVFVFLEDTSPDMPQEIEQELVRELRADGSLVEYWQDRPDKYERAAQWMKKNYKGWTALRILPPEQVHMETFMFTDQKIIEFIPDSKTKNVIGQADAGDPNAGRVVSSMPADVIAAIKEGKNLPLNTDPDAGSFVHYLARKMSQYDTRGHSSLEPCLRALTLWDKCLVPGTPVWILRDGIIQSVPVETIQTETDLLLTHKGNFAHAIAGSRIVSEPIIAIQTGGVAGPLKLTGNHRVFVMTDAGLLEKEASSLKEGDLLCEAFVQAGGQPLQSINLQEWWVDRQIVAPRRYRRTQEGMCIRNAHLQCKPQRFRTTFLQLLLNILKMTQTFWMVLRSVAPFFLGCQSSPSLQKPPLSRLCRRRACLGMTFGIIVMFCGRRTVSLPRRSFLDEAVVYALFGTLLLRRPPQSVRQSKPL